MAPENPFEDVYCIQRSLLRVLQNYLASIDLESLHSPRLTPPSSLQYTHKRQRIRLNIADLIPLIRLPEDLLPSANRPLLRIEQRHHTHIRRCAECAHAMRQRSILSRIIFANIIDEYDPRARLECWDQRFEDSDRFDVWPVVQDPLQDVDVGLHGLGVEEVMGAEGDSGFQVGRELLFEDRSDLWQILNDNLQVGVGFGERDVIVAC